MNAPQATTRDRIVEAARWLFHRHGYANTSLADILRKAEANSGSLYYFFRSKEDLLHAVLDWYLEHLYPEVMDPAFARTDDPIERIFAVLAGYREMLVGCSFEFGCPVGNLAIEAAEGRPAVAEKVARNFTNWCGAIEKCLNAAADRLPADLDRPAMARFILTVMEGAIMQARAHRALEPFDASITQLRDYFNRLMGGTPGGARADHRGERAANRPTGQKEKLT
jgi:AcrR family transcriptional regulator